TRPPVPGYAAPTTRSAASRSSSFVTRPDWYGPLTTWTPRELESNARPYTGDLWRIVEAQYTASTMRLVDSLDEQAVLEATLEASKPKLPAESAALDYLLATPFRYRPRAGSRFRRPFAAGVWYGAEAKR